MKPWRWCRGSWQREANIARLLGLDVGDVRIGVALSDPMRILASPVTIIERRTDGTDYDAILELVRSRDVERIIVGMPLSVNGSMGGQAQKTVVFTEELRRRSPVPVVYQDERLSTAEAMRMVREARKTVKKERYDAAAAALILQEYLDDILPFVYPGDEPDAPVS